MKPEEYGKHVKRFGDLNRDSRVLSSSALSDTNQVFYADDLSSVLSNTMDLSVRYVTQDQFHGIVVGDPEYAGLFEPKTLYIVSSDEINAYNTNIKNVANPREDKDAANKWYVDDAARKIDEDVEQLYNELQRKLDKSDHDISAISSDYLKATEFSALSNEIGLSAANANNLVVTKKDIADLAGAMHFRGAVTPNEGETDQAALARVIDDPASGDVAIITTTSKEYVYNGEDWIELGDEVLYATKAEVSAYALKTEAADMSAYAYNEATAYTDAEIAKLSADRFALSADVDSLVAEVSAATLDEANGYTDTAITNLSNSNVYISSISSDELGNVGLDVAEKLDKFTIYKFDSLSAYNLSGSSFGILSSDIVLIDEENINAEGHRILSVASPELSDDAATKGYVDNAVASANANLKAKIAGSTAINALISQVNPSDGISNVEIETAISALLDLVNILSGNA